MCSLKRLQKTNLGYLDTTNVCLTELVRTGLSWIKKKHK